MWHRNLPTESLRILRLKSNNRLLLGFVLVVVILVALAFYAHLIVTKKAEDLVRGELLKMRDRYGVLVQFKQLEAGFGGVKLEGVTVGQQPWFLIDHVKVGFSFNLFSDFLRPNMIRMGSAKLFISRDQQQWPAELKKIKERILGSSTKSKPSARGKVMMFLPKKLSLSFDEFSWAHSGRPLWNVRDGALKINFSDKRVALRIAEVVMLDRIKETFFEGDVRDSAEGDIIVNIRQRPEYSGKPTWSARCLLRKSLLGGRCDIDADRLPDAVLNYAGGKLGKVFTPGYRGSVGVDSMDGVSLAKSRISVHGVFENISVENSALAVSPVGPVNLRTATDIEVDIHEKSVRAGPSDIFVFAPGAYSGSGIKLSTQFSLTFDEYFKNQDLPAGNLQIDAAHISCADILRTIPVNFMPELEGFDMEGTAALRTQINLDGKNAKFSIAGSSFNCRVTREPEMYSIDYLGGPFVIERDTPSGKITIPVDPSRPYFVAYKDVPAHVRSAFVASEDTGFFRHRGVEIGALVGAVERNAEAKRAAVGGSTITMQTVKNLFLARDKTLSRKMQEIFLAWHLEQTISKERILEIYLNMVEFGPGLYGIGRASQRFFGKDPRDLTLKEALYMASLLPAPIPRYRNFCKGVLSPAYLKIIKQLLDRMLALGKISVAEHASAVAEKIEFSKLERETACAIDVRGEDQLNEEQNDYDIR